MIKLSQRTYSQHVMSNGIPVNGLLLILHDFSLSSVVVQSRGIRMWRYLISYRRCSNPLFLLPILVSLDLVIKCLYAYRTHTLTGIWTGTEVAEWIESQFTINLWKTGDVDKYLYGTEPNKNKEQIQVCKYDYTECAMLFNLCTWVIVYLFKPDYIFMSISDLSYLFCSAGLRVCVRCECGCAFFRLPAYRIDDIPFFIQIGFIHLAEWMRYCR